MGSVLHRISPLPVPGTVERFVIDVLDGVAQAYVIDSVNVQPKHQCARRDASWRFLRWIDLCEAWCGERERSGDGGVS